MSGTVRSRNNLIANGAQPTIFSAAMLGQTDVVRAFVAAQPGVQRITALTVSACLPTPVPGRYRRSRCFGIWNRWVTPGRPR